MVARTGAGTASRTATNFRQSPRFAPERRRRRRSDQDRGVGRKRPHPPVARSKL